METRIVNLKKEKYDVYIGRPSIFGNPFNIGKDGNREEVIEKHLWHFLARLVKDRDFRKKVLSLKGKTLGCYCKPLGCHGDIIVKYLENK